MQWGPDSLAPRSICKLSCPCHPAVFSGGALNHALCLLLTLPLAYAGVGPTMMDYTKAPWFFRQINRSCDSPQPYASIHHIRFGITVQRGHPGVILALGLIRGCGWSSTKRRQEHQKKGVEGRDMDLPCCQPRGKWRREASQCNASCHTLPSLHSLYPIQTLPHKGLCPICRWQDTSGVARTEEESGPVC